MLGGSVTAITPTSKSSTVYVSPICAHCGAREQRDAHSIHFAYEMAELYAQADDCRHHARGEACPFVDHPIRRVRLPQRWPS